MLSILAVVVSLALLMFLAYRGVTVLLLAPVMGALAVVLSGESRWLLPLYTDTFMSALGGYVLQYLPLFLLGALFGRLMADSGAASTLARWIVRTLGERHAILTVVLACALLTYGGVSLFVVAFAIYPIARNLFEAADIPKRLVPATIALGAFTFTMTALPGSPAIQNAIPIPFFGTNGFAAPGLGLLAASIMLGGGLTWLLRRANTDVARSKAAFWQSASVEEASRKISAFDREALVLPLIAATHSTPVGTLASAGDRSQQLTRLMRDALHLVLNKLQSGQVLLATVGSTAPFVGLLGTVWGIYHALISIASAGQISIDKIAGPVGEALIMTAAGLAVAIPAVLAYNFLVGGNKTLAQDMDAFAHDLHVQLLNQKD